MIAFDTNLLVRIAVGDDPEQVAIACQLMQSNTVFLPRTVLLEAEWVLRARYATPHAVYELKGKPLKAYWRRHKGKRGGR